ncbi:MAG: endonuclease/exonuclease/phosphatase family protein [Bacteroidota bacterium]|nr:endonuclease/exonuclease/phosphatase family protein [Bacteroidota bacterium]
MTGKISLFRRILIAVNSIVILAYLITCLVPFVNTGENWIMAFPGLIFPFLVSGLIIFIIILIFLKSKWGWISLVALLMGFQQILVVFSFNLPKTFKQDKKPNTLRVIQWNVTSWDEGNKKAFGGNSFRLPMLELVKKQNADILCFEEFFEPKDTGYFKPNISAIIQMGFPYYYFVRLSTDEDEHQTGTAIFSRYPIIDSSSFSYKRNYTGEHLLYIDIKIKDKIFRIFATHLQPVYFDESEYHISNWMNSAKETDFGYTSSLLTRFKRGYEFRYNQADFTGKKIAESPYPSIVCGDFNDVPNSSSYFLVKGNLQDPFLKKGSGFGRTIPFISSTLRIDYIFADKKFKAKQFQVIHVPYSNHYPIETDLAY